jgi:hypothetical protein
MGCAPVRSDQDGAGAADQCAAATRLFVRVTNGLAVWISATALLISDELLSLNPPL